MKSPKKILIVDDHPTMLKLAEKHCEKMGLRPVAVRSCAEALVALSKDDFAAIIMDLGIPRTVESMRCLRELVKLRRQKRLVTPIIATTAHAMDGDRKLCLDYGVDDYLSEPYTAQQFQTTLNRWVNREVRCAS